jgi:hypothetical protein
LVGAADGAVDLIDAAAGAADAVDSGVVDVSSLPGPNEYKRPLPILLRSGHQQSA